MAIENETKNFETDNKTSDNVIKVEIKNGQDQKCTDDKSENILLESQSYQSNELTNQSFSDDDNTKEFSLANRESNKDNDIPGLYDRSIDDLPQCKTDNDQTQDSDTKDNHIGYISSRTESLSTSESSSNYKAKIEVNKETEIVNKIDIIDEHAKLQEIKVEIKEQEIIRSEKGSETIKNDETKKQDLQENISLQEQVLFLKTKNEPIYKNDSISVKNNESFDKSELEKDISVEENNENKTQYDNEIDGGILSKCVEREFKENDKIMLKEEKKQIPTMKAISKMADTISDTSISPSLKLGVLCSKVIASDGEDVTNITDSILYLMISEDMQRIKDSECLKIFFRDYLKQFPLKIVAEILSVLIAVLKKSLLNLDAAKGILLDCLKQYCVKSNDTAADNLIKHFLREIINYLASYSCNVQELKSLLSTCQEDPRLLHIIRSANIHQKGRPNSFFAFPGTKGSVLALPPLFKWPIQNGWTFITWFRLEPNSSNSQPFLYFFRTSKSGVGYSAHFTGNCLVLTSMKVKSKGYQHCIPYEFVPFKWYHCAIVYVTKWRASEIKVFVNGQMTANTEMSWQVQTQDVFDKCFIGGTADLVSESHLLCGQLSSIYLFHEALSPSQICAIHRLGPSYSGQYKYPNEMGLLDNMPVMMKKVLYEEKLSSALMVLYSPVAVERDTLCLQSCPKGNTSYFTSAPHAALLGDSRSVNTLSISDTLQSIGGVKALFSLLNRFTGCAGSSPDPEACSTLIGFICDLLESSLLWFGNEVVHSSGFVIISAMLMKNSRLLLNEECLDIILNLTKTLMSSISTCQSGGDSILLKQLMDSILFNSSLWIYVDAKLQIRLYCYLATEFLSTGPGSLNCDINSTLNNDALTVNSSNGIVFSEMRRISTVLQLLHSLKYYYWLVPEDVNEIGNNSTWNSCGITPISVKAKDTSLRPSKNDLISIRNYILLFIKQLIMKGNGVHQDELQAILNYLSTVHQDDNLLDVLLMLQILMVEHPSSMIPAFDVKQGIRTVFKLLDSSNEEVRIQSIKLLGYFLTRSTYKRKQDVMGPNNLFMLLREKLMRFTPLTNDTYNTLFEILVETPIETVRSNGPGAFSNLKIENPLILKVIATLIIDGKKSPTGIKTSTSNQPSLSDKCDCNKLKKLFISDLWRLLVNNRDNRRLVLQMSVWQHWLINLVEDRNDHIVRDQILAIFRILLYHAIKYEYGGWRVWIDTLAIIHAKVSFDEFMTQFGETKSKRVSREEEVKIRSNKREDERTEKIQQESRPDDEKDLGVNSTPESIDTVDVEGEHDPVVKPSISTISASGSELEVKNDNENNEVPDVAPTRSYRKNASTHSTKDDQSSILTTNIGIKPKTKKSASATPAFRIPEFRWSSLHWKLLNDLLYSIECDLQMWRSQGAKEMGNNIDVKEGDNKSCILISVSQSHLEQILQHPDNQTYIANAIHLISQLCDNVIIASGGLLPLLATATGGNSNSHCGKADNQIGGGSEGLSLSQANSLLYRLVNLADILCFAATHVNFAELEQDKNMTSGGILRQCLRIVCTIAVKNCLAIQKQQEENGDTKDVYDLGTSISAASQLFGGNFSGSGHDESYSSADIGSNEYISGSFPPLQPLPIKDASKLLQEMDISRLRACIYRDADADAKQSQFLALATLYFISVLMVSEYRDIIEPKVGPKGQKEEKDIEEDMGTLGLGELRNIEQRVNIDLASIGDILTSKLEARLSSVCPLLREIMCDFSNFLSKTLLGSHGQDLVSKEAVRTFRRSNSSPVELVMLLCSQEWQNTLQKNAGLAFIELINEGRLLSHAMKDHIVRVAMEAEFILNRLRADDVSKHEAFNAACLETLNSRNHEENLINSLINSAKRRDRMIYIRFRENIIQNIKRSEGSLIFYKLDTWEDDARRKRRFVLDPYGEENVLKNEKNDNYPPENIENVKTNEEIIPTHLLIPKHSQTTREGSDDESELFLWESEDISSSINGDIEEGPSSAAEFAGTVLYAVECYLIWNIYAIEGTLQITANELFFEATNIAENISLDSFSINGKTKKGKDRNEENLKNLSGSSTGKKGRGGFKEADLRALRYCELLNYNGKIGFSEIRAIFTRRYLLQQNAIEIFLSQRTSVMFAFKDLETVKKVIKHLPAVGVGVKYGIAQSRRASLMHPKQLFSTSNMTVKWQKREISNFEYLMFLNTIAGRTYQDLNQYPVFPWILTNYESSELDLSQPTNFRDLSKPIGALNAERRAEFIERYNSWDNNMIPAFHYGTHYSTAAFTLSWLIRLEPFYSAYMALQDGRLEDESRLFNSIRDSWMSSLMGAQQNVKELIPELFYLPEICTGTSALDKRLKPVELPKWAESSEHFIRMHRMALESDLVSCQLHQWIDLIFGYKQRGPEAVRAVNVFYYLTYEGNVDFSSLSNSDPNFREAIESQIRHFGQTPCQLTTEPHPPRSSALHVSPLMFSPVMDEVCMSVKFPFNASVVHLSACCSHNSSVNSIPASIVTINSSQSYHIHKWNPKESNQPLFVDQALSVQSLSNSSSSNKRHNLDTTSLCSMFSLFSSSPRYIVTIDSKHIIMAPFFDNSFRVFSTETGKLTQVIYGHRGLVTCLSRSECNVAADFYVASGSKDCCILFWTWNAKFSQIEGTNGTGLSSNPLPKLILTGHESEIRSLLISAELGLIVSGSRNLILIHTITNGDCICCIDVRKRNWCLGSKINSTIEKNEENEDKTKNFKNQSEEKEKSSSKYIKNIKTDSKDGMTSVNEDYLINNLVFARESGFIVGTGVCEKKSGSENSSLLFTYNLKGELHRCVNFAHPKDLGSLLLVITRDGEYLIISESQYVVKIIRTFDLTPLYALNTSDIGSSNENGNVIKSMLLVDYKYLLVGTDNGRLIIYKLDFNRWHQEYSSRY